MEFAFRYRIWELLRHEKVPETHVLATPLTGNALVSMKKRSHVYQISASYLMDF